jgi:DNA-binding response OmpR family regulator
MSNVSLLASSGYQAGNILLIEDDTLMSDLLSMYLRESDFQCISVKTAEQAWELLLNQPENGFESILLDKNLPGISGIEFLSQLKANKQFMELPVILETADASDEAILEGLNHGAYYYLTKPIQKEKLISTITTATREFRRQCYLKNEVKSVQSIFANCRQGLFTFKTLLDSQRLAIALANMFPEPERAILGLSELMMNAVEHGNLEIGYDKKSELLDQELLIDEIDERLEQAPYSQRTGTIKLIRDSEKVQAIIADEGQGFDWRPYLAISLDRVFDQHGRGIAMAKERYFDQLEYQGNGNRVICTTYL